MLVNKLVAQTTGLFENMAKNCVKINPHFYIGQCD